ncbi:MAG: endonuclease domain-containing protein [Fimbriimonas sp.]
MPRKDERLTAFARQMRKAPMPNEDWLWPYLQNRRFMGVKFRRQAPIGPFIADFLSYDPKLIIELDGGAHDAKELYDENRQAWLESQGYTVLRFGKTIPIEDGHQLLQILKETVDYLQRASISSNQDLHEN